MLRKTHQRVNDLIDAAITSARNQAFAALANRFFDETGRVTRLPSDSYFNPTKGPGGGHRLPNSFQPGLFPVQDDPDIHTSASARCEDSEFTSVAQQAQPLSVSFRLGGP